jgi:hypothetical protein
MENIHKAFELQIDEKPNGAVIRLNDETGCLIRICGIPKETVYDKNGELKKFIDITILPIKYSTRSKK